MSGLKGITVNTAPEAEPHVYAEDDAAIFQAICGRDGVSTIGQSCKATVLSNNKVRIADGVLFIGGHFARIPFGDYVDCEIENGKSGVNRNDIIVAKFTTTGSGGVDTFTCEVKKGTEGTTATDPELTQEDVYAGGKIREFPLYRVRIEGLSIVAVDQLFEVTPTKEQLVKEIAELNSNIINELFGKKNYLNVNCDSLVEVNGAYRIQEAYSVNGIKYGILFVFSANKDCTVQIAYNYDCEGIFTRVYWSGIGWSPWKTILVQ